MKTEEMGYAHNEIDVLDWTNEREPYPDRYTLIYINECNLPTGRTFSHPLHPQMSEAIDQGFLEQIEDGCYQTILRTTDLGRKHYAAKVSPIGEW